MKSSLGTSLLETTKYLPLNSAHSDQPKILVVDDHPTSRMAATAFLSADGYQVLEADSGTEALKQATEYNPDLILLDIMLPHLDGFEVCRRLKGDQQTTLIPVVFVTVNDDRHYRQESLAAGGDDFLIKPLDRLELSARVKSLIDKKRLNEDLNQTERLLFSIAEAIEKRDSEAGSLGKRVGNLVQAFGEYLQLSPREIEDLMWAAHLHDIGTVGIPDAVMLKQGALNSEELDLVRQHVLIGEKICQPLQHRPRVLEIIRHHHERWDGSGYPDGIAGEEIPKLAQIFQIIDIYDALTRKRSYKQAYSPMEALQEMKGEAQKGWRNPQLVKDFTQFIESSNLQ